MTATIYFVRHGSHDRLGRVLCGRMAGVRLSEAGRAEARSAGLTLAARGLSAVYSSPLERTYETAELIAQAAGLPVVTCEDLNEVDFGEWTGATIEAVEGDPRWGTWNRAHGVTRPPSGESLLEVQSRLCRFVDRTVTRHPEQHVAAVSHGDPIKTILAHAMGMPLDNLERLEISPASISVLVAGEWGMRVWSVNEVAP